MIASFLFLAKVALYCTFKSLFSVKKKKLFFFLGSGRGFTGSLPVESNKSFISFLLRFLLSFNNIFSTFVCFLRFKKFKTFSDLAFFFPYPNSTRATDFSLFPVFLSSKVVRVILFLWVCSRDLKIDLV